MPLDMFYMKVGVVGYTSKIKRFKLEITIQALPIALLVPPYATLVFLLPARGRSKQDGSRV